MEKRNFISLMLLLSFAACIPSIACGADRAEKITHIQNAVHAIVATLVTEPLKEHPVQLIMLLREELQKFVAVDNNADVAALLRDIDAVLQNPKNQIDMAMIVLHKYRNLSALVPERTQQLIKNISSGGMLQLYASLKLAVQQPISEKIDVVRARVLVNG